MMIFAMLGVLCGVCLFILLPALRSRRSAVVVTLLFPICVMACYLALGHSDIPASPAPQDGDGKRFQVMLLAEKPVERIEATKGRDMAALAIMGDLNMRLDNHEGAARFYSRALARAKAERDPRMEVYQAKLDAAQK